MEEQQEELLVEFALERSVIDQEKFDGDEGEDHREGRQSEVPRHETGVNETGVNETGSMHMIRKEWDV